MEPLRDYDKNTLLARLADLAVLKSQMDTELTAPIVDPDRVRAKMADILKLADYMRHLAGVDPLY